MLMIDTLALGSYQTNCYIVRDSESRTCAVIDPGYTPEVILTFLEKEGLAVDAILLTHGHFDHVGAVKALVETTGCALWIHEGDHPRTPDPTTAYFYPLTASGLTQVHHCADADTISAGGLTFTVWSTPGHTRGSVCYACEDALFSGDTLFAGSCGRMDLPGGDPAAMQTSLARLAGVKEDYRVYPGHGGSSTLSLERQYNPYLEGLL